VIAVWGGMSRHRILTLVSLPLLAIPAVASAQEAAPLVESAPTVFPSMGADGAASEVGAQLMLMDGDGGNLKRFDVNAQYVLSTGLGGYATIGGSSAEGESAIGSLEVGGLYRRDMGNSAFAARVGLVLPTASTGDGALLNLISTVYARPSDYLTGFPETTSLRVAFAPSMTSGNLVARADVGLDLAVAGEGSEEFDSPFLHVDVGGGYTNGQFSVLAELGNMIYLDETDDTIHLLAVTAELHAGKATPYLTISRPFTTGDGDLDITNFALGVRGRL
jgi:hypothetical protein